MPNPSKVAPLALPPSQLQNLNHILGFVFDRFCVPSTRMHLLGPQRHFGGLGLDAKNHNEMDSLSGVTVMSVVQFESIQQ